MDSNKDEALKCIGIAKEAISAGNKERALKFIKISQRLNDNLSVDDLLTACERMGSSSSSSSENEILHDHSKATTARAEKPVNKEQNYTIEHVQLIRQVNQNKDYYAVLGVENSCSMEDIKKAYRKLSLKVHPDKNKAPGAEEAFKKVSKAFKCLSEEGSRLQYDQTGHVEEYEHNQQHVRRRRQSTTNDFFDDDFDPDEIFRAFFGQTNAFHTSHVFRTRGTGTQNRTEINGGQPGFRALLHLIPFVLLIILTSLPSSDPGYSLQKTYSYQIPRVTEKYGVGFFVKSLEFDRSHPVGSESRAKLEEHVIHDYKNLLTRHCQIELQRRQWSRHIPTPHCDRLQIFGQA